MDINGSGSVAVVESDGTMAGAPRWEVDELMHTPEEVRSWNEERAVVDPVAVALSRMRLARASEE